MKTLYIYIEIVKIFKKWLLSLTASIPLHRLYQMQVCFYKNIIKKLTLFTYGWEILMHINIIQTLNAA